MKIFVFCISIFLFSSSALCAQQKPQPAQLQTLKNTKPITNTQPVPKKTPAVAPPIQINLPPTNSKPNNTGGNSLAFEPKKILVDRNGLGMFFALDTTLGLQDSLLTFSGTSTILQRNAGLQNDFGYGAQARIGYRWDRFRIHVGYQTAEFQNHSQAIQSVMVDLIFNISPKSAWYMGGGVYSKSLNVNQGGKFLYRAESQNSITKNGVAGEIGLLFVLNPSISLELRYFTTVGNQESSLVGDPLVSGTNKNLTFLTKNLGSLNIGLLWHDFF